MMLTQEDVDFLLNLVRHTDYWSEEEEVQVKRAENGLKELKKLWSKEGLPIMEVDVHLLGEVPGRAQRTQIHTFAIGDIYKLLPEDEDPEIASDGWKVRDIRANVIED